MRRRDFPNATQAPRGEPFHQVVHRGCAIAGRAGMKREEIARRASGE